MADTLTTTAPSTDALEQYLLRHTEVAVNALPAALRDPVLLANAYRNKKIEFGIRSHLTTVTKDGGALSDRCLRPQVADVLPLRETVLEGTYSWMRYGNRPGSRKSVPALLQEDAAVQNPELRLRVRLHEETAPLT